MAKQIKPRKSNVDLVKGDRKINKYLIAFPVIALVIKLIVVFNIQAGGWAGADSWQLNSGIVGVDDQSKYFDFEGQSGLKRLQLKRLLPLNYLCRLFNN
jgi:hypothetical protein